jgi:hypothetical protein
MKMNITTILRTTFPPQPLWTALVCLLAGLFTLQPASAVTLTPSVDSRSTQSAGPVISNTQDMTVGPVGGTSYYRSYMTFDLSAVTTNNTASRATLKLFGNATSEGNSSLLPQVFTLFQVFSNWDGTAAPGPEGTALATVNITPALGNDSQNIEFSGTNLVNAFNNAIGGLLYLGIKSDKEGVTNRSFCNFQSMEDPSKPTLNTISANLPMITISVPDASAAEPGADTASFTLNRGSATNGTLTVFYTFSGTATHGSDYTESGSGNVTFAAGASNANVVITAVNDAVAERLETVILTVTSDAAYNIDSPGTGTAMITDDNDDNNDVLVRYIFTDANATDTTFSLAPQVYSTNMSATALTPVGITLGHSSTTVSPPNAGYINAPVTSSNQTEAIANNDYFSFTLTPTIGHSLTLTNLELSAFYFVTTSMGTNASLFVRSSLDNYTSDVASNGFSFVNPYAVMSIPLGAAFTQVPSNITFRVYVFDDSDTATEGLRIDDLFVRGSLDALPPGYQQVNISAADTNAVEHPSTPDSGQFTLSRYGDTSGPLTIHYTIGGTAISGVDYNLITNEVTLGIGVSNALINITPIDDLALEGAETVTLTLIQTNGYLVVAPASATVTIVDDEAASLRAGSGTLTLVPATASYNRLTVTITAEGSLTATDTKTTDASGTLSTLADLDVNTGTTLTFTLITNGSHVTMTPMNFNLRAGIFSVATLNISNMAGTAYTGFPPGAANPNGTGATFDASLHRLLVNQGSTTGELTIPLQPAEPINEDFASSPLDGSGSGTGTLTVTPTSRTQFQQFFNVVMTLPVDFTQNETFSGTPVAIRVQGTLRASGPVSALLNEAGEIAAWNFDAGSTSAARRTASNVAPGATVSALNFNASFIDVGVEATPAAPHDGLGFGTNSGDTVIRLRRANYFDNSAVPDPRPTVQSYTSWGDGSSAGTGANLLADGNAPIAFTVTANAASSILITSLTADWTSGNPITVQFQEAGASPGPAVAVSGAQNTKFTIPLAVPVVIAPGQTKTFTLNLNSGALNSSHNLDGIALNGVPVAAPDPYQTWSQTNGLTAGVNDGFGDNPDLDEFPNGLEWILGGSTPLANDQTGFGTTGKLLNLAVDGSRNLVFTFQRIDESEGRATLTILFSNDLFVSDNHEVTIGASGPQGSPPSGVTVQVVENGSAADTVTVTIPASYAGSNHRLFGRLRATRL